MRLLHSVRNDIFLFVTISKACENWGQSPILCHRMVIHQEEKSIFPMRLLHSVRNDIFIFVTASKVCENWGQSPILCHYERSWLSY
jgi:hypothetical protein